MSSLDTTYEQKAFVAPCFMFVYASVWRLSVYLCVCVFSVLHVFHMLPCSVPFNPVSVKPRVHCTSQISNWALLKQSPSLFTSYLILSRVIKYSVICELGALLSLQMKWEKEMRHCCVMTRNVYSNCVQNIPVTHREMVLEKAQKDNSCWSVVFLCILHKSIKYQCDCNHQTHLQFGLWALTLPFKTDKIIFFKQHFETDSLMIYSKARGTMTYFFFFF